MSLFDKLRELLTAPDGNEAIVEDLLIDIAKFEVTGWVESLIDFLAFDSRKDEMLPPDCLSTWRSFDPMKQEMAFLMLLGSVKALMEPPEESAVYVS